MVNNPLANPQEGSIEDLFEVKNEQVEQAEKEVEQDIPSNYIKINLPSNGRVEGIPTVLHFRDYTGNDALDLNVFDDEESTQVLVNVLKRMCYEKFDISLLPVDDVLYILYILQFTFISSEIQKNVYIDETLPQGDNEGEIDYEGNIAEVTIPFSSIRVTYLGKDKDDKDLEENVKFPVTLTDSATGIKMKVKLASLKDTLVARNYCKKFFRNKFIEFADIRKSLSDIQSIKKKDVREQKMNDFLINNEDEVNDYYFFMNEYALTVAKFIQALQIVSYNGEDIEDIEKKWELYQNNIPSDVWQFYNQIIDKYSFGIDELVKVNIPDVGKVERRVSFQLSDFLSFDRKKTDDRYSLSFD